MSAQGRRPAAVRGAKGGTAIVPAALARRLRGAAAALLGALLLLPALACAATEIGAPAPALRGELVSGEPFDLARYRGKVVLVNFYSSYCRGCAYEIGSLETFLENHRDEGFDIIMIGVDRPEDTGRVARMLGIYNLQGAMTDALAESGFERRYPTPTGFVIDREGVLRERISGAKTLPRLDELLLPWIRKPR